MEIIGAVILAGIIVALAFTGVVASTLAVLAVGCVIVAVLCMFLGAAFVLFFKLALAVLLALFCEWLYARALGFAGERLSITALQDPALVTRVSWILAAVTTGYLCFLR